MKALKIQEIKTFKMFNDEKYTSSCISSCTPWKFIYQEREKKELYRKTRTYLPLY